MATPESLLSNALISLWTNVDHLISICASCGLAIRPDQVLARTFCLDSHLRYQSHACEPTETFDLPKTGDKLLFFHRHLNCLEESSSYIAISHVWSHSVADAQANRCGGHLELAGIAETLFNTAALICQGVFRDMNHHYEIWHDYVSVPQWQERSKALIIPSIPRIFKQAACVLVYATDLDMETIMSMRSGRTSLERCQAVSDLCSLKWFSRVWTAMEYAQCTALRFMTRKFQCVQPDILDGRPCGNLFAEMQRRWKSEITAYGDQLALERSVDVGDHLVPWQIGPVEAIRRSTTKSKRPAFALVYQVFAKRCISNPRDFLSVMLGLTGLPFLERSLDKDMSRALKQIAQSCVERGDVSPLFVGLWHDDKRRLHDGNRHQGYNATTTFGLGGEQRAAPVDTVRLIGSKLMLRAECLGDAHVLMSWSACQDLESELVTIIECALELHGDSIDNFLQTLGRMYGASVDGMYQRLSEDNRMPELQQHLTDLTQIQGRRPNIEQRAAWIADATGVSNRSLPARWTALTPMQYMQAHGGTIHFNDNGLLVTVTCRSCHRAFLIRVGALKTLDSKMKLTAWRIPNLKYDLTLTGGCGLLLEGAKIVGRFVWAAETCSCYKTGETEIELNDVAVPEPNEYDYGAARERSRSTAEHSRLERSLTASSCRMDAALGMATVPLSC